ncbi:MAG: hypothetical protein IJ752_00570 [Alphaproteobacteria bacterium]|nr:hypothetical protein [Alphaproteobacteria bacterium]
MISAFLKTLPYLRQFSACRADTLYIDGNHRRQRIEQLLMQKLKKGFLQKSIYKIDLFVYTENSKALFLMRPSDFL